MDGYFWDCGVFYACACRFDRVPPGVHENQIDRFSDKAEEFLSEEEGSEHVSSDFIMGRELVQLMKRRERAVIYLLRIWRGEHLDLHVYDDITDSDRSWIRNKLRLRSKYNAGMIESFFDDFLAVIEENLAYLKQNIIKKKHDRYEPRIQKAICELNNNRPDSRNFATAIDYHTSVGSICLLTTDKKDYVIPDIEERLEEKGIDCKKISVPDVLYLLDYSSSS